MRPKQLIEIWVSRFNEGDPNKIADLYHRDAINHQVANEPVDMHCMIENIFEDDEW